MKYRNTKTGAVIDVNSKIRGGDWEMEASSPRSVPGTKKSGGGKKRV